MATAFTLRSSTLRGYHTLRAMADGSLGISFVGSDAGGGNAADTSTLGAGPGHLIWPSGIEANDFALLFWTFSTARTPTTPSGFDSTPVITTDNTTGSVRSYIYKKFCTGSEDGTELALINDAANRQCGCLVVYRGVNLTTPIDGTPSVDNTHTTGTTHNHPAYTPNVDGCYILGSIHERATNIDTNFSIAGGYAERSDTTNLATGSGGTITTVADDGLATFHPAGTPVTPPVWTGDHATGTANIITYTLALRPAEDAVRPRMVRRRLWAFNVPRVM